MNTTIDISEAGAIRRLYKRKVAEAIKTTMRKAGDTVLRGRQRNGATYRRVRKVMAKNLGPAMITPMGEDYIVVGDEPGGSGKLRFAVAGIFGSDDYGVKNEQVTCTDHIVDRVIQDAGVRNVQLISAELWQRLGHCVLFHIEGYLPHGKSVVVDEFGFCVLTYNAVIKETDLVTWVPRVSWSRANEAQWGEKVDKGEIIIEGATAAFENRSDS